MGTDIFFKKYIVLIMVSMLLYASANGAIPKKMTIHVKNNTASGVTISSYIYNKQTKKLLHNDEMNIGQSKTYNLPPLQDYQVVIGVHWVAPPFSYGIHCHYFMTGNPLISSGTVEVKSGGEFDPKLSQKNMVFQKVISRNYKDTCPYKAFAN